MELRSPVGIGTGALAKHQIVEPNLLLQSPGRAHPEDVLHTEDVVKLMRVDADGRHTHTGGHNRDLDALVGPGVTLNAPDVVHENRIFQEGLRNKLRPQGIAGHQDGFAKIAGLGIDMGSRIFHNGSLLYLDI